MAFRFLDLPAEVRVSTYRFILDSFDRNLTLGRDRPCEEHATSPPLLRVSKQIRKEAIPEYFQRTIQGEYAGPHLSGELDLSCCDEPPFITSLRLLMRRPYFTKATAPPLHISLINIEATTFRSLCTISALSCDSTLLGRARGRDMSNTSIELPLEGRFDEVHSSDMFTIETRYFQSMAEDLLRRGMDWGAIVIGWQKKEHRADSLVVVMG